jgi:hypothetical protein
MKIIFTLLCFYSISIFAQSEDLYCLTKGDKVYFVDGVLFEPETKTAKTINNFYNECSESKSSFRLGCLEISEKDFEKFAAYRRFISDERNTFTVYKSEEQNCIDSMSFTFYSKGKIYLDGKKLDCTEYSKPQSIEVKSVKRRNYLFCRKLLIDTK